MTAIPDNLTQTYGDPVSCSGDWVTWFHRCPQEAKVGHGKKYPMLLYNLRSGWLSCKACGHKRKIRGGGADIMAARVVVTQAEASEAVKDDLSGCVSVNGSPWIYATTERGFTEEEVDRYGFLTAGKDHYWLKDYLVIPIFEGGEMVSWHARDCHPDTKDLPDGHGVRLSKGRPRWLSPKAGSKAFSRRTVVWGIDRVEQGGPVYVCEGIMDAAFFDHGVAYMGPVPTEVQVAKILDRKPKVVILCPDYDTDPKLILQAFRKLDRYVEVWWPRQQQPPVHTGAAYPTERQQWLDEIPTLEHDWKDYGEYMKKGLRFFNGSVIPAALADKGDLWWLDMKD